MTFPKAAFSEENYRIRAGHFLVCPQHMQRAVTIPSGVGTLLQTRGVRHDV